MIHRKFASPPDKLLPVLKLTHQTSPAGLYSRKGEASWTPITEQLEVELQNIT